jgi:hypothetical protein
MWGEGRGDGRSEPAVLAAIASSNAAAAASIYYQTSGMDRHHLKVHKIENFFGFDFEFCTVSLQVMLKYEGFVTNNFLLAHYRRR